MYRLFTVALVALHLILFYVLAVGTGGILGRQFFRFSHAFKIAYGVAFTGVFISNFAWQACILTLWEKQLCEKQAAGSAYGGTFVDHYLPFMSSVGYPLDSGNAYILWSRGSNSGGLHSMSWPPE